MSSMEPIETITNGSHKIMEKYGQKLGYDDDKISMYFEVLDSVKTILDNKVRPNLHEWDSTGCKLVDGKVILPKSYEDVLNELIKDNELYTWFIPEKYGGYGYEATFQAGLSELLSRYDLSLQVSSLISLSVLEALIFYYKPEYDQYLKSYMEGKFTSYVAFTEPQAGSNLINVNSTSVKEGDEYVLNGTKIFISNGGYANSGLFLAKNMVNGKQEGTNVFFVDGLEGITTVRLEEKSGLHCNPTAQLLFEDVRVPEANLIADEGDGYRKVLERLMGMRSGVVMQSVGLATRGYELARAYAEEREQFGKPIISFDGVSRKLKQMEKQIPRLREFGYGGAYSLDRYLRGWIPVDIGASGPEAENTAKAMMPSPARVGLAHYFISAGKLYCAEIANSMLYDAQQIFGGNGFVAEYEVNKLVRDARILPIYEGTSEIHEWLIGRATPVLDMLPKFKRTTLHFPERTMYENILENRFPGIFEKI